MNQESAISVRNLNFAYNGHTVLSDVSLDITKGEYVGVIGPNGGGKTTFLKLVLGLLEPDRGSLSIFGDTPSKARNLGRVGYVPQRAVQFEKRFPATVLEVVQSGLTSVPRSLQQKDAVKQAMEATDIANLQSKLIHELSGGQRQRVFIARCLTARPRMLLLDEPVTGVDIPSRDRFYALLKELNAEKGITILFVTHDVDAIAKEVHQVLCLNQKVCCHASPQEFLQKHVLDELYSAHTPHAHG